jgi:glycosyltransferase involved in cell wall biosynthesis
LNDMKNILIISFFHSSSSFVGAIRTQRFVRYLPEFGWTPFVITKPAPNNDSGNDAANTFYARSIRLNKPFRLESFTWIPFMLLKASKVLRRYRINVVLISCPPFHQALAGILLKKLFRIKLVVDYRDAWSLNPYYQNIDWFHQLILQGDKMLEEKLLRYTDLLTVSHQVMKESYLQKFPFLKDKVEVIYNGFDPERVNLNGKALFSQFSILHLGDLYVRQKGRDPDLFLAAIEKLIAQERISPDYFRIFFVGGKYPKTEKAITEKGLSAYTSCLDRVPYAVGMEYLNRSHLLILIEKMEVMTTKVYEYLATGKPMLCLIRRGGELESLIRKFSSNSTIIVSENVDEVKEAIWKYYEDYQKGRYRSLVNEEFRKSFSRIEQTRHLVHLLDRMIQQ